MLTPKTLIFQNIGRFVEPQTIDFTKLGNLVQVEGQNNNTKGSSGAAKTTIFKALNWCLGLDGPPTTILQSRLTKDPIQVTLVLDWDGREVRIERGKKLSIELPGETIAGSSKLSEEKLDEILGMSRDLFSKILHKKQGEQGFFLNMGPSEVHKFLTSCLGLDKEQKKLIPLDTKLEVLVRQESSLKGWIGAATTGVEATESATLSLGLEPTLDVTPGTLDALKMAQRVVIENHTNIKETHKKEMDELESSRPQISIIPFNRRDIVSTEAEIGTILSEISALEMKESERKSQLKTKISELQIAISNLKHTDQTRQYEVKSKIEQNRSEFKRLQLDIIQASKAKEDAVKLAEELKKVRASICPTCEQNWATDAVKDKEAKLLLTLQELKKLVIAGTAATARIVELDSQYTALQPELLARDLSEIKEIDKQIGDLAFQITQQSFDLTEPKLKLDFKTRLLTELRKQESDHQFKEKAKSQVLLDLFAQKQTVLRTIHESALTEIRQQEKDATTLYETAKHKISIFEQSKVRYEESLRKLQEQKDKYQNQLEVKNAELTLVTDEIELNNEAKKVIKSYLSASFEDALDSIGDAATRLIRSIPNMATATIQFDGLKESKDGKVKEEVNCVLSMDGEIGVPVKSLSGGERSSTDLAVDLSVIRFIEEKTGNGISLYVLDEAFTGLDTVNVLEALEMLKESSIDKCLILIDHNQIATQSIENKILVVRDGLTSSIVQQ